MCLFAVYNRSVQRAFFFEKTNKRKVMKKQVDDPGGPLSPAARKKQKTVPSPEEKEEKKNRKGEALRRRRQEIRLYNEMVVKTFLLGHIKDPYGEKLRDAIKNVLARTRRLLSSRRQD
jgi:hypothetical protein